MKQTPIIIPTLLTIALLGACGTSPTDSAIVAAYCDGAADYHVVLDGREPGLIAGFKMACEEDMSGTSVLDPDVSIEGFPG